MDGGFPRRVREAAWANAQASFNYLLRYKGINFVERHYDYLHTQSFASVVDDMTEYCGKMGGGIR